MIKTKVFMDQLKLKPSKEGKWYLNIVRVVVQFAPVSGQWCVFRTAALRSVRRMNMNH